MSGNTETIQFLETVAEALKLFGGDSTVAATVQGILDRGTRYIRIADLANADRVALLKAATAEVQQLIDGDTTVLDAQLDRIRERSSVIAAQTAELEEQLAG